MARSHGPTIPKTFNYHHFSRLIACNYSPLLISNIHFKRNEVDLYAITPFVSIDFSSFKCDSLSSKDSFEVLFIDSNKSRGEHLAYHSGFIFITCLRNAINGTVKLGDPYFCLQRNYLQGVLITTVFFQRRTSPTKIIRF